MGFLRVAVLVTWVAGVACQQTPVVPVIEAPPVELKIKVSDSVLVFGKTDTIKVIVKNTLNAIVRLSFATQCQDKLFIKNLTGVVVLPATGNYQCAPVISQLSIPANDSIVRTYYWTGGQTLFPPDPTAKLPAGRYFVSAILQATNYSVNAFAVGIRLGTSR